MKKLTLALMMTLLIFPAAGMAATMDHGKKMDHGAMGQSGSMAMDGPTIMLQDEEVEGVKGSSHLMDTKEMMAKHGMSMTHHLMVGFMNSEGESIVKGKVAVIVESPDGKVAEPVKMMMMDGQFGVDVQLDQKGVYHFKIGTKLADGKKRTFHFHHEN